MATIADAQEGLPPPPGNLDSTERFPDFLFTRDSASGSILQDNDNQEDDPSAEHCNLSSPAVSSYSRSSTVSSISTAASSLDSNDCYIDEYHKQRSSSAPPSDFCS